MTMNVQVQETEVKIEIPPELKYFGFSQLILGYKLTFTV